MLGQLVHRGFDPYRKSLLDEPLLSQNIGVANTMPPRDPDGDEEDDDEENRTDEPPVVREPDEV